MNKTNRITSNWLLKSGLAGDELLLEGLLRRGFLAFRDEVGVWLGTGSHPEDLEVLRLVRGLRVEPIAGHKHRMARLKLRSPRVNAMDVTLRIVALLENYHSFTSGGIPDFRGSSGWNTYRKMTWGAKLPIGPAISKSNVLRTVGSGALDLGIALLVKALPLARVATSFSCDGHGEESAEIWFCFDWDSLWGKAVFETLGYGAPNSTWNWNGRVTITPRGGFGDVEMLGMLNDIQDFARCLLQQSNIEKIGRARARILEAFGEHLPGAELFANEARSQLNVEFA